MDLAAVERLEEVLLSAWPAAEVERRGPWVLSANAGVTGRANSLSPLGMPEGPTVAALDGAEAWYRVRGLTPMCRLTPLAGDELPELLDARGYRPWPDPADVMVAALTGGAADDRVVIASGLSDEWLAVGDRPREQWPTVRAMTARIQGAVGCASLLVGGRPAAVGQGVVTRGHLSIFGMYTAPDHRGQGLGRAVLDTLHAWGSDAGATMATLQVTTQNAAAQHLYRGLGYEPVYSYRYLRAST